MALEKIQPEELEALIDTEEYPVIGTTTLAVLTVRGGFVLIGQAACLNPADFDAELGRTMARSRAVGELMRLEAYHRVRSAEAPLAS